MSAGAAVAPGSLEDQVVLGAEDVEALAVGCAVLSTGGGGDVDPELDRVRRALGRSGPVALLDLAALEDDVLVLPLSVVGAPRVGGQAEVGGGEAALVRDRVERDLGRRVGAVMATEIGGANGLLSLAWAADLGLPLLDADGMGRAFPELPMISMNVAGIPPTPAVLADAHGNVASLACATAGDAERWVRALTTAAGGSVVVADYLMTGAEAPGAVVAGSVSRALGLGRSLTGTADPGVGLAALAGRLGATAVLDGEVSDVSLVDAGGFLTGTVRLVGPAGDLLVEVRNEYVAVHDGPVLRAVAPDMLQLFDLGTGRPVATETLVPGQRVRLLHWACDPLWWTDAGRAVAGPAVFGHHRHDVPRHP